MSEDIFLAKFNSSGTKQWSRFFGETAQQRHRRVLRLTAAVMSTHGKL